jgi:hypothetical protein
VLGADPDEMQYRRACPLGLSTEGVMEASEKRACSKKGRNDPNSAPACEKKGTIVL